MISVEGIPHPWNTMRGILLTNISRTKDGQLRAIWRIALFVVVFFSSLIALTLVAGIVTYRPFHAPLVEPILTHVGFSLAIVFSTWVMLRFVEHRDWSMVFLHRDALRPRQLLRGTVLGMLPIAVPAVLLYAAGWLTRVPNEKGNWPVAALAVTLFLLPAAFTEELFTRGYPFAVIRERIGRTPAILITAISFGLLHATNPGANAQSLTVVALSGVFLGVLLLATGSLYAASLGHAGWNWVMAVVLHTPVSGLPLPAPNYRVIDSGPDWATGGSWGPESGIPAAIAMILLLIYMIRSKGNRYPLTFTRQPDAASVVSSIGASASNG